MKKLLALAFLWVIPLAAEPVRTDHAEAELVSEVLSIHPGQAFWVGLRLKAEEGWHTYWKDPGDSGMATKISWKLPSGFQTGEIQWPQPQKIVMPPLTSYGYEGEVFLLTEIHPPASVKIGETVVLRARADWLVCKEICLPGRADLELSLPVKAKDPEPDPRWQKDFTKARQTLGQGPQEPPASAVTNLWIALAFSFVGGLILNLMPCVLPVLSIKILSFVHQAQVSGTRPWKHGIVFCFGVLASFWILAGLLLLARSSGQQLGWGFQLQSPVVLAFLTALFFLMSLNLLGVFEIGTSFMGLSSKFQGSSGYGGSFTSGVLATIVATPCTAPFMGSALGFAMTQPSVVALLVFTGLGLGMAAPYALLSSAPGLLKFVPKPGPWIKYFKQFLGLLLLATAVWLLGVLWQQSAAKKSPAAFPDKHGLPWEVFSEKRLQELRQAGAPVFIDFTAAWCLSCQVNERVTFRSRLVQEAFAKEGIVLLKADWTSQDDAITKALAGYGRNSVPLYVFYPRGPGAFPVILPEIITPKIVLEALQKSKGP